MDKINEMEIIKRCIERFKTFNITLDHITVVLIDDYKFQSLRWHNHNFIRSLLLIAEHRGFGKWDNMTKIFECNPEFPEFKGLIK